MNTRTRPDSRCGASMTRLIVVVLAAPVITFGVVSGLVMLFRGMTGPELPAFTPPSASRPAEFKPARPVPDKVAPKPVKNPAPPAVAVEAPSVKAPVVSAPGSVAKVDPLVAPPAAEPAPTPTPEPAVSVPVPEPAVKEPAPKPEEIAKVVDPVPAPVAPAVVPPVVSAPAPVPAPVAPPATNRVARPAAAPAAFQPEAETWMLDDFEADPSTTWKTANWGNPALLSGVDGALKVEMIEGKADKVAIGRSIRLDLTSRSRLVMDVMNNTPRRLDLAVAFIGGGEGGSRFFESTGLAIKPGLNADVTIDLKARTFKCAESEWKHNKPLENASAVKQVYILIYGRGAGEMFLDNIRGLSAGTEKAAGQPNTP